MMKNAFLFIKKLSLFVLFGILIIFLSGNSKPGKNIYNRVFDSRWTGTVTCEEIFSAITGTSERHVMASFNNALPTLYRDDETTDLNFTDDKGTGSVTFHAEGKFGVTNCEGSGQTELHWVVVEEEDNIYSFHVIGPACTGTSVVSIPGTPTTTEPYGPESTDIVISGQPLVNKNLLGGTKTEVIDIDMGGGVGTLTRTITWHLTKSTVGDVELIVIPQDYDTWLPKPGRNELTEGSIMNISLKLQARGGGATTKKAKVFELRLSNTSREPGITVNFPTAPDDPMPDLRFLVQSNGQVEDEFQSLNIDCPRGCQTAQLKVGSYDGGGWTTLTAEAILQDDTRIQGRLLVPGGEVDIRIPKRDPNSKIGKDWLTANGNPNEMDDKETSRGNTNNGDGLTAYEEYRGVISEGSFKRLDPNKKEVGILATQGDFTLFSQGIGWFKNTSGLEIIRFDFDRNEIAGDGRLNVNKKSAHDYDQYALYLLNGGLGGDGTLGIVYSKTNAPDIPAQIISVVADWNAIQAAYQRRVNSTRPETLKFTLKEYLAQTVAHELGHAINIWHHGRDLDYSGWTFTLNDVSNNTRIFDRNGNLDILRPITLQNIGEKAGTVESGDLSCMLNYYPYYTWGYAVGVDGAAIFNREPLIPLGKIFCKSKIGTGFNATQLYFGDCAKGNCLGQIKLRN